MIGLLVLIGITVVSGLGLFMLTFQESEFQRKYGCDIKEAVNHHNEWSKKRSIIIRSGQRK